MKRKKIIALLMAVMMVFAMAPCMAFAEDPADQAQADAVENYQLDDAEQFIAIKLNFGAKHKATAKKVYNYLKSSNPDGAPKPALSGATVTAPVPSGSTLGDLYTMTAEWLKQAGCKQIEPGVIEDNSYYYCRHVGTEPMEQYPQHYLDAIYYGPDYMSEVTKNATYYVHWHKPLAINENIDVSVPVCGTDVKIKENTYPYIEYETAPVTVKMPENQPLELRYLAVTEPDSYGYFTGKIKGGQTYNVNFSVFVNYAYGLKPESVLTVNGDPSLIHRGSGYGCYITNFQSYFETTAIHAWDKGVSEDGTITYTCSGCGDTYTVTEPEKAPDGTSLGAGASFLAADEAITGMTEDTDPAGTAFDPLKVRSTTQAKQNITIKWTDLPNASSYVIYGAPCGAQNHMVKLDETDQATYQATALKKGTYHKFMVVALGPDNRVVASSRMIHVATKGGKVGNYKNVTIKVKKGKKFKKATSATVAAGKTLKTKVTAAKASKKLKVKKHVGTRYESSDEAVATVTAGGVITGVAPGTCQITAYAQNGVYKVLKLTVK
ncbi:MAG: Ig-like domain-containing protein [Bacillota bacterium]|nr:Ig-like domain-containing protein [Bacillota bacterium]